MNKKKIIIAIFIVSIILLIGFTIYYCIKNSTYEISNRQLNETSLNKVQETIGNAIEQNVTNEVIAENVEEKQEDNTTISNSLTTNDKETKNVSTTVAKETLADNAKNTNVSQSSKPNAQTSGTSKTITQNKEVSKNVDTEKITTTQTTTDTSNKQTTKEEKVEHPELAYTTYRKVNTSVVPEIIKILQDEIAKYKELVDFGTKAVAGNKADAYKNTTEFTYMFVNDVQKGKVKGNYTSFPVRVRNNVGAFGTYYVYAEDEYAYDGNGTNPKWSQTLVWIWVSF